MAECTPTSDASTSQPVLETTGTIHSDDRISILGFGSLLSERSSRMTFPDLQNFRLVRVPNYRRIFAHPTSIFFQRKIADLESKQMASLSAEYCAGNVGFVAAVFDVSSTNMMKDGVPSQAFLEREEEFDIIEVPYQDVDGETKRGILCAASTDEKYMQRWGKEHFVERYEQYGIDTIWHWRHDSDIKPCAVYLRHCYLAAKSMGDECFNSFLDDTYLVDRTTTLRQYMEHHPEVLDTRPPSELAERYCG